MNNEIWKDIKGYEGIYQVSNRGRVKSLARTLKDGKVLKEKIMNQRIGQGYYRINLSKNGKQRTLPIHRLVALTFIPNHSLYTVINHKDENKHNNNVENLEWCTSQYNVTYGNAIKKRKKKIFQLDMNKNLIKVWDSASDVQKTLGFNQGNIIKCAKGKVKYSKGYIWVYEDYLAVGGNQNSV